MFVVIRAAMEDFIEKVKEHPCLWDVNSVLYRDISKKEALWEAIAGDCGMDGGKTAKLLWKRLRDSHREALRRRRNQGAINRPWKYEELMEFILPHFGNRESNENEDEHAQTSDAIDEPEISITVPQTMVIPRFVKQKTATLKLFEERAKRRRREMERGPGPKKVITARQTCSQPTDALTELFSSMCKKTKQLPKHLQLRVQREVFDSVTRAEEEVLCYDQDHDKTSVSAPPLFMFKTSPRSELESESAAASRDDDMGSDNWIPKYNNFSSTNMIE